LSFAKSTVSSLGKILSLATTLFGKRMGYRIAILLAKELVPNIQVKTDFGDIKLFTPGEIPLWRANTLLTKEPDTIEWINSFEKEDVFWDIGANNGNYSLYAAIKGIQVMAFVTPQQLL
jgi:hypothetical protein